MEICSGVWPAGAGSVMQGEQACGPQQLSINKIVIGIQWKRSSFVNLSKIENKVTAILKVLNCGAGNILELKKNREKPSRRTGVTPVLRDGFSFWMTDRRLSDLKRGYDSIWLVSLKSA